MRNSQCTGVSTFASPASQRTYQSLQKSFHLSQPKRISKFFFHAFKKIKTRKRTDRHDMTVKLNNDNGLQRWTDRRPTANSVLPQLAVTCKIEAECYYHPYVQVDSFVLRNPPERKAPNRYSQA